MINIRSRVSRDTAPSTSAGLLRASSAFWYEFPFRWQLIIGVLLLALLTGVVGGVLAVLDARARAAVETSANIALWKQHIGERAKEVQSLVALGHFAASLAAEMRNVRHVAVRVVDIAGNTIATTHNSLSATLSSGGEKEKVPNWFLDLVQPEKAREDLAIAGNGSHLGNVIIVGEPSDEIAESWELLEKMAVLWMGVMGLLAVGLYFLLGHILNPLVTFAGGLNELEDGHYAYRIEPPRVKELAAIAASFNTLAAALDKANAENSHLYRQLVAVQEDERRQLSRDLHDEFGPCIFGLSAGLATIERQARQVAEPEQQAIVSCVEELSVVTARLKALTRNLLSRLRPVALGRVTLAELIADLVVSFQKRHADVRFEQHVAELPVSFGEAIDVTIYRSIQEGLTNALRHGKPTLVAIGVTEEELAGANRITVRIEDNGIGLPDAAPPPGYGLSGMRERARALGGTLAIEPGAPAGTILTVTIPVTN
ncbi:MAG: ATP-binding protein [Hyphomicrobium sp.]|jgi:two-component system sensor histidine kinase UhpB